MEQGFTVWFTGLSGSGKTTLALEDIKRAFDGFDIKIILGIREQSGLVLSLYKYYVSAGGVKNINDFLSWISHDNFTMDAPFFKRFEYSNDIDEIMRFFGEDNLHIYIAENLREKRQECLRNLLSFMGEKEIPAFDEDKIYNRGYGRHQMRIALFLNRFFKTGLNPKGILPVLRLPLGYKANPKLLLYRKFVQRLIYRDYKMPPELKRKIKGMYIEDNKKINGKYGLNLPGVYF